MDPTQIEIMGQWFEFCYDAGVHLEPATEMGQKIVDAYSSPKRHYHTLEHISHCFFVYDQIPDVIEEDNDLRFAIWFHDFVYDPKLESNESQSAEIAYRWLQKLDIANPVHVQELIRSTADYLRPPQGGFAYRILHDVDLAILASEDEIYRRYEKGIREEYEHLSDQEFFPARKKFLHGLLERRPLFALEAFEHQWERKARLNIRQELKRIEKVEILPPTTEK
tara:strand:+ start:140 stop:808 length:669 start_codon:yes stop_codon:yes gene_type:complete